MGVVVLAIAALGAQSVALAGFGLDFLIEIGASTVVVWQLTGSSASGRQRATRLIGVAFVALAMYVALQSSYLLVSGGGGPTHSPESLFFTAQKRGGRPFTTTEVLTVSRVSTVS